MRSTLPIIAILAAAAAGGSWLLSLQTPEKPVRPSPRETLVPAPPPPAEPTASLPRAPASEPQGCPKGCAEHKPGCDIKGNISYDHIYHLPGQKYYDRTRISPWRGERWFCTEDEARSNGWRKSKV